MCWHLPSWTFGTEGLACVEMQPFELSAYSRMPIDKDGDIEEQLEIP